MLFFRKYNSYITGKFTCNLGQQLNSFKDEILLTLRETTSRFPICLKNITSRSFPQRFKFLILCRLSDLVLETTKSAVRDLPTPFDIQIMIIKFENQNLNKIIKQFGISTFANSTQKIKLFHKLFFFLRVIKNIQLIQIKTKIKQKIMQQQDYRRGSIQQFKQERASETLHRNRNRRVFTSKLRKDTTHDYQKFMISVYQNAGKRQIKIRKDDKTPKDADKDMKKITYFEFPETFPKLINFSQNQFQLEVQAERALTSSKGFQNGKYKVLKTFLNTYQQVKKKTQIHNMNILGLEIKKLDYSQKKKTNSKKSQPCITYDEQSKKTVEKQSYKQKINIEQSLSSRTKRISENPKQEQLIEGDNLIESIIEDTSHTRQLEKILKMQFVSQFTEKQENKQTQSQIRNKSNLNIIANHANNFQKYVYFHEKIKKLKFNNHQNVNKIYEKRINSYKQFIFKMQFAHNVYIDFFKSKSQDHIKIQNKYKIWIGPGNNSLLIKSLLKRRFWWVINDERTQDINFVWSQIKINDVFLKQKPSKVQSQYKSISQKLQQQEQSQEQQLNQKKKDRRYSVKKAKKANDDLNQDFDYKILIDQDKKIWHDYKQKFEKKQQQNLEYKKKHIKKNLVELLIPTKSIMHNHLENNFFLGNKKAMFYNLKQYYQLIEENVFDYLPLTFHIKNGIKDPQYKRFLYYYKKRTALVKKQEKALEDGEVQKGFKMARNIWIVKPGELSNRGNGITVIDEIYELNSILNKKQAHINGTLKTYIVQLYIDRPLLYNRRKFDIRHYMLITNLYGIMRGYWYSQGYIRTSSYQFDIFNFEREIHLTNDAVQKYTPDYGKYEAGNKLSYGEFQRYLDSTYPKKHYSLANQILPKMKQFARDSVKSAYLKLSPNNLENNFQIFGFDFMIDENFKPWLIQINTNPCLQLSCPLLQRIIPTMVEQSLRMGLDVVFPPPTHYCNTMKHLCPDLNLKNLKFELIFDSQIHGDEVRQLYKNIKLNKIMAEIGQISDDQQFADNGYEINNEQLTQ